MVLLATSDVWLSSVTNITLSNTRQFECAPTRMRMRKLLRMRSSIVQAGELIFLGERRGFPAVGQVYLLFEETFLLMVCLLFEEAFFLLLVCLLFEEAFLLLVCGLLLSYGETPELLILVLYYITGTERQKQARPDGFIKLEGELIATSRHSRPHWSAASLVATVLHAGVC